MMQVRQHGEEITLARSHRPDRRIQVKQQFFKGRTTKAPSTLCFHQERRFKKTGDLKIGQSKTIFQIKYGKESTLL